MRERSSPSTARCATSWSWLRDALNDGGDPIGIAFLTRSLRGKRFICCVAPMSRNQDTATDGSFASAPGDRQGVEGASPLR